MLVRQFRTSDLVTEFCMLKILEEPCVPQGRLRTARFSVRDTVEGHNQPKKLNVKTATTMRNQTMRK